MKKYRDFTMPAAIYLTVCTSALNIALNRLNRTLSSLPSQISDKVTAHVYERHLSMAHGGGGRRIWRPARTLQRPGVHQRPPGNRCRN